MILMLPTLLIGIHLVAMVRATTWPLTCLSPTLLVWPGMPAQFDSVPPTISLALRRLSVHMTSSILTVGAAAMMEMAMGDKAAQSNVLVIKANVQEQQLWPSGVFLWDSVHQLLRIQGRIAITLQ